ncbi:MAG: hypothetical protein Q8936_14110 [Bacillota bacterium]|nr:hypothetical protein [Bacillota bacterium]
METQAKEGVGATAFDLPNSENPMPHAPIFHTKAKVPRRTNEAAKIVNGSKIMRQVMDAK